MHLTVGQAARVLECVGQNPAKLTTSGRGVAKIEKAGTITQWTLFALLLWVVTFSSPAGILLTAGMIGVTFLLRKRRSDRQAWEDAHWTPRGGGEPRAGADAVPSEAAPRFPPQPITVGLPDQTAQARQPVRPSWPPYRVSLGRAEWPTIEVVGEHAYGKEIRAALHASGVRTAGQRDTEVEALPVELVPEPDNPFDPNAISLRWRNQVLGYLSREDAIRYAQPVRRITASRLSVATTARILAYEDGSNKLQARVTVALPEPELIAPLNDPPTGVYTLVPWGPAIQVLKEEDHFDVLFNHVPPEGVGLLLVSLHKTVRTLKNGAERAFVEVRLDGERVGELSTVTSAHFLPLLDHTEPIGETVAAYAKITGSALAAQLTLHAARATEISNDWLSNSPHPAPKLVQWASDYEIPPAYGT